MGLKNGNEQEVVQKTIFTEKKRRENEEENEPIDQRKRTIASFHNYFVLVSC